MEIFWLGLGCLLPLLPPDEMDPERSTTTTEQYQHFSLHDTPIWDYS